MHKLIFTPLLIFVSTLQIAKASDCEIRRAQAQQSVNEFLSQHESQFSLTQQALVLVINSLTPSEKKTLLQGSSSDSKTWLNAIKHFKGCISSWSGLQYVCPLAPGLSLVKSSTLKNPITLRLRREDHYHFYEKFLKLEGSKVIVFPLLSLESQQELSAHLMSRVKASGNTVDSVQVALQIDLKDDSISYVYGVLHPISNHEIVLTQAEFIAHYLLPKQCR